MKKILLLIISFSVVLAGCGNDQEITETETSGTIGSALTYNEFTISLDDAYYSNFPHDGIEINFERYLAADLTITNSSNDAVVAKTLTNFTVIDNEDNVSRVMLDENRKKFSSNLMPGESFEITLVFPVNESSEYTLSYSYGPTVSQEDVLTWTFDLQNKKYQSVDKTVEHRKVDDVVKTFLFGDGSNEIEFEYKPASKDQAASEVSSEASEVQSEVTANE